MSGSPLLSGVKLNQDVLNLTPHGAGTVLSTYVLFYTGLRIHVHVPASTLQVNDDDIKDDESA